MGLADVFGANAQADEMGGGSMEEAAAAEDAERKGSFDRPGSAEKALKEAVDGGLEGLGDAGGQLAAVLDVGEREFGDGCSADLGRAKYGSEDARGRHGILNGEINADAANGRHGMGGVADAEQTREMPAAQAIDLDGKERHLIPRLDLVGAGFAVRAGCSEKRNERCEIVPEGFQAGGLDMRGEAVFADDVAALEVIVSIDHDDHAAIVQVSESGFRIVGTA